MKASKLLAAASPLRHASTSALPAAPKAPYNPYRSEPVLPAKPPRKAVVKNLKFGRLVEATSPSGETVQAVHLSGSANPALVASTSNSPLSSTSASPSSSSYSASSSPGNSFSSPFGSGDAGQRRRNASSTSTGNSSNNRYRQSNQGPRTWLLASGVVALGAAGLALRSALPATDGNSSKAKAAQDAAMSNEPYDQPDIQNTIATFAAPPEDDTSAPMATRMQVWIKSLQDRICASIEQVEAAPCYSTTSPAARRPASTFLRDSWLRKEGGEGISCVLQDGRIFEKAGVNVSVVHGTLPPPAVRSMTADHEGKFKGWYDGKTPLPFKACGISCVMHPHNPAAPTVHFNYRYFEVEDPKEPGKPKAWWFGGGADLTPSYLFPVDAEYFHTSLAAKCSPDQYSRFKSWCDEYFRIKHRGETRGLGGIFFDDLSAPEGDIKGREELFSFVKRCGEGFVESYVPIVSRRKNANFTERMRQWQQLRRGRYVEFNLVYDRGTQFGLRTPGARIESILMSLPLTARWEYFAKLGTEPGSEEAKLLDVLRSPRDWARTA